MPPESAPPQDHERSTATAAPKRELHFVFEIVTDLGEGDEIQPSIQYVADWLNDNGYGYVEIQRGVRSVT